MFILHEDSPAPSVNRSETMHNDIQEFPNVSINNPDGISNTALLMREGGRGERERERIFKLLLATRKIQICFNSVQLYSCVVPCHSKVISRHVKQVYITLFSRLFPPTAAIKKYLCKRHKPRAVP